MRAYHRNDEGTLDIIEIIVEDDGTICDPYGYPMSRTDEVAVLRGWPDEGEHPVYVNDGGREIIVPLS